MNQKGFMFNKNNEYRPGSQGGSVKLMLTALVALALSAFVAAPVMAELSIKGGAHGTFGSYTDEHSVTTGGKTYSTTNEAGLRVDTQAQIDISGGSGNVSAKMRLRVREGSNTGLAVQRNAVTWKASDQLSLTFNGESFGRGGLTGYGLTGGVGTFGDGLPIGDQYGNFTTFANTTGLDVNFNLGEMNVGLMILDECKPTCGYGATTLQKSAHGQTVATLTTAGVGTASKNAQTMVPYFEGNFGAIHVGAFIANASADVAKTSTSGTDDNDVSIASSGTSVVVDYTMGDMKVGVLIVTTTQGTNTDATNGGTVDANDLEGSNLGIGFKMGAIQAHYTTVETKWTEPASSGTTVATVTSTEIAASYKMAMDGVTLIPQFASKTGELAVTPSGTNPTSWESTQTYVGLGIATGF